MSSRWAHGAAIRRIRVGMKLTQQEFARKCDVGTRWINKVENYQGKVSEESLRAFAEILGYDFDEITVPEDQEESHLAANRKCNNEDDLLDPKNMPGDSSGDVVEVDLTVDPDLPESRLPAFLQKAFSLLKEPEVWAVKIIKPRQDQ